MVAARRLLSKFKACWATCFKEETCKNVCALADTAAVIVCANCA